MPSIDEHGRPEPPLAADELDSLVGYLEWQRATFEWKTRGLDTSQLMQRLPSSSMTLGGLLKHMAWVEDHWFSFFLHGRERADYWLAVDWATEPNWEWTSAAHDSAEELRALWASSVEASRRDLSAALANSGLDQLAKRTWDSGESPSLRWIMLHMIEEYARHNGHADLLREAIDGQVGE